MPSDEQQSISLAVLSNDIKHFTAAMLKMDTQLTNIITNFATKADVAALEGRIAKQEAKVITLDLKHTKTSTEFKVWLGVASFAICTFVSVALLVAGKFL